MSLSPQGAGSRFALGMLAMLAACSDGSQSPNAEDTLVVGVKLSGLLPSRTVQIIVNDTIPMTVEGPSPTAPLYARSEIRLPLGTYRVRIVGLDPNCVEPPSKMARVGGYRFGFVSFDVECRDDHVLAGRAMAWIDESDDDWGNSPLSLRLSNGNVIRPGQAAYTTDADWSEPGDVLAVLRMDSPSVIFFSPDGSKLPWGGVSSSTSVAIAWVPHEVVLSVLELGPDGCRVMLIPPTATTYEQTIPCGGLAESGNEYGGDIAWSPDGLSLAVAVGLEPGIRLVNRGSGTIVNRKLPEGLLPSVIKWSETGSLFVLAQCALACSGENLTLLRYEPVSGLWHTLASWESPVAGLHRQTLEFLDPGHLAVGPIAGSIHVVALDAPGQSRVFLPQIAWRLTRRR